MAKMTTEKKRENESEKEKGFYLNINKQTPAFLLAFTVGGMPAVSNPILGRNKSVKLQQRRRRRRRRRLSSLGLAVES